MSIPLNIVAGTDVGWLDVAVPAAASAATVHFRQAAGSGTAAAEGAQQGLTHQWRFTLDAVATAAMEPGAWFAQGLATVDDLTVSWLPITRVQVIPSLVYPGEGADVRSSTEVELEEVRAAIKAVYRAQEYEIGAGRYMGRKLRRADLRWLEQRERTLMLRLEAEQLMASGRSRRVLIEFE